MKAIDHRRFYDALFAPAVATHGALDRDTLTAVAGFDAGGPVSLSTIGHARPGPTLFITCELAVREDQVPSEMGRYELMTWSDDEDWAWSTLTDIAGMTLEAEFGHLDTLDIGPWVAEDAPIQGILFSLEYTVVIDGEQYAVFRCSGLTRAQLERAVNGAADEVAASIGVSGRR